MLTRRVVMHQRHGAGNGFSCGWHFPFKRSSGTADGGAENLVKISAGEVACCFGLVLISTFKFV